MHYKYIQGYGTIAEQDIKPIPSLWIDKQEYNSETGKYILTFLGSGNESLGKLRKYLAEERAYEQ